MTTLARPLSAGRTMMDSSSFRLLSASRISFVMLCSGGSACWRMPLTALLTVSACSASSCLTAASTLAMISVAGIFAGVTAKFSPFFSRAFSASLRDLEDKLTTQLALSTYCVDRWHSRLFFSNEFFKLLLMPVFGGVEDSLGVCLNLL